MEWTNQPAPKTGQRKTRRSRRNGNRAHLVTTTRASVTTEQLRLLCNMDMPTFSLLEQGIRIAVQTTIAHLSSVPATCACCAAREKAAKAAETKASEPKPKQNEFNGRGAKASTPKSNRNKQGAAGKARATPADEAYASDTPAQQTTNTKANQSDRSSPRQKSTMGIPDIRWGGMPIEANLEFIETDSTSSSVQMVSTFLVSTVERYLKKIIIQQVIFLRILPFTKNGEHTSEQIHYKFVCAKK